MYNESSCELSYKPFYHLAEAVIRWCGLLEYEAEILHTYLHAPHTFRSTYPQWPCLHLNLEKLFDAVMNNDLPYGSLGVMVKASIHVPPEFLTVRHADLKAWMVRHYPDQKPPFLFDEIERSTHTAISTEAFHILQAERDALRVQLNELQTSLQSMQEQHIATVTERDRLLRLVNDEKPLTERTQRGYPTYVPLVSVVPAAVLTYGGSMVVIVLSAVLGAIAGRLPSYLHPYIGNVLSMAISTLLIVPAIGLLIAD